MKQIISTQQHFEIKMDTNTVFQQNTVLQHPACQLVEQKMFFIYPLQQGVGRFSFENSRFVLNMQLSESQKNLDKNVDMKHTTLWWNMIGQHLNTPERELSLVEKLNFMQNPF